jgi:restriction system protein
LVIDVLVAMGYGGSREDAASVVGRSGDEGIDGIIKEDRLGLDTIYVQAKRWRDTVGRPEIQRFAGALQGKRARKGVFITTSSFTLEAREYADGLQTTIVLIDGPKLADLMVEYEIGVSVTNTFKIHRLDEDYFIEE